MSSNISTGIDIGSHNTRVVVLEHEKKKHGFRVLGIGSAKSQGVRHGYVINQEEAGLSIREAVDAAQKSANIKIRHAIVSIGGLGLESAIGSGSHVVSRVDGEVGDLDIKQVLQASEQGAEFTNKKIIREFPLFFKLDGKEVLGDPRGMRGHKLETKVFFVTSFEQHFDSLINAVENAGIDVDDVIPAPFAESIVTLTKAQRTAGCVLANIGGETVSIVVFENDKPVSLQVFPIGGADITNYIALGLRISLDEAEMIKTGIRNNKEYPQKKLDEMIESRLRDIFDLIEAHLKKLNKNELLPAGIVITGGSAALQTTESLARASLKLPARVTAPFIGIPGERKLDTSWAIAYGLAILGFDDSYARSSFSQKTIGRSTGSLLSWFKQFLP